MDGQVAGAQLFEKEGGEVAGDGEGGDAAPGREVGDEVGGAGAGEIGAGLANLGLEGLEGENLVKGGFLETAAEFEGAEDGDFFAAPGDGEEGVVAFEAAKVEEVAAGVGVGVEEKRGRFGGHSRQIEMTDDL